MSIECVSLSAMGDRCYPATHARNQAYSYTYMIYPSRSHQISYLLSLDNGSSQSSCRTALRVPFFFLPPPPPQQPFYNSRRPPSFLLVHSVPIAIARARIICDVLYTTYIDDDDDAPSKSLSKQLHYIIIITRYAHTSVCIYNIVCLCFFLRSSPVFFESVADV